MQSATPSDNTLNKIERRAQQYCYKDVAKNLDSGMPLALAFDKGEKGGLGCFVIKATIFDHSGDKIISIRLNSDDVMVKDG